MSDRPGRTRRYAALWILVPAVAFIALLGVATARRGDPPGPGDAAPSFEAPALVGDGTLALSELRGRPVVLNFWASWCVPCRKEMPALQEMSEEVQDRIAFVGVNHQDSRGDALSFLAETGVRFPAGYDPEGATATSYGLYGMPTTIFISPDGRILQRHRGEISESQLRREIERLFLPPP